jgi:hypothetical protein
MRPIYSRKFSKTIIAPEERHMGPYPFGLFLVSSSPNYGQNINTKALNHLGSFPRKKNLMMFNYSIEIASYLEYKKLLETKKCYLWNQ